MSNEKLSAILDFPFDKDGHLTIADFHILAEQARELEAEVEALRQALTWCSNIAWQGLDIDGGSFQDEMTRRGLLVEVPASEEIAAEFDTDVMFSWVWGDAREASNEPRGKR